MEFSGIVCYNFPAAVDFGYVSGQKSYLFVNAEKFPFEYF